MKRRWIQDRETGELIEADAYVMPEGARVYIHGDYDTYASPVTGKPITGRVQRRDDMKRHGCVDYEPSMKKYQTKIQDRPVFADVGYDNGPSPGYERSSGSIMRERR